MLERNTDPDAKKLEQPARVSIAFGLERIGLIAIRKPVLSCIILFAMVIGAVFGIERIKIDDSLSQLFRSNSKEYRQYEEVTKRFPSTEYDVLVVVEGKGLLQRKGLEAFANLTTELQLVEGVSGLVSMLSARGKPLQLEDVEVVAGSGAVSFNKRRFGGQVPHAKVKPKGASGVLRKSVTHKDK